MVESGVFELGVYIFMYVNLYKVDRELKIWEIVDSKIQLEMMFGVVVDSFVYLFGIYDQQDVVIVVQLGYIFSVMIIVGIDEDLYVDFY